MPSVSLSLPAALAGPPRTWVCLSCMFWFGGLFKWCYFSPVPLVNPDQIKLYWVVPLSGVGLRVGTPAVGGLGTSLFLNFSHSLRPALSRS
ncbi:T-lymphoma invasion and metastasis-inducing protein 2, partial [Dissostichus eleginoides]